LKIPSEKPIESTCLERRCSLFCVSLGNAGPDKGKGGKFLFLPPGYEGDVPDGYFVYKSPTFGNWFAIRAFLVNGDPRPGAENLKRLRIHPLAEADSPGQMNFVNVSGKVFNTIHAMDFSFFEEVNEVVQEEPSAGMDPETLGLLASIGIEKGKRSAMDSEPIVKKKSKRFEMCSGLRNWFGPWLEAIAQSR